MNPTPLLTATQPIPLHAFAAMAAMTLGAVQLALPKGTSLHRGTGYIWVVLMGMVAISSFAIYELQIIGPFSPIHALSVLVLGTLWIAVRAARRGDIARHKRVMILLYGLALMLTGAFTLMPGRIMHTVLFGGTP